MTTPTPPAEGLAFWAQALTPDRIASDLQRLADDVRFFDPKQRKALLTEAAKRLTSQVPDDLRALIRRGLTFGAAMPIFAEDMKSETSDKYIAAAREYRARDGEVEIDDDSICSGSSDDGDYVLAWVWVSNEEAGLPSTTDHDELDGGALREHLTEAHGLPESERQDMSDPACHGLHEKLHANGGEVG